ncbi:MAG: NUDIX hydrolase [Pyrinomonadaceae bacterium]
MIKKIVKRIWGMLPAAARTKVVRATQDSFTVSTAAIVRNEKDEILLLNHVLRPFNSWGFPGGFVEHGEQIEEAVRREVREETGIELRELKLFEINTYKRHIEVLWSAIAVGEPEVRSAEIIELGWFAVNDLPAKLSRNQHRQVRKILGK